MIFKQERGDSECWQVRPELGKGKSVSFACDEFAAVGFGSCIYALPSGGVSPSALVMTSLGTWNRSGPTLPNFPHQPTACEFGGKLCVTGGRDSKNKVCGDAWSWDGKNEWVVEPPLRTPRIVHALVPFMGRLFAIGGMDSEANARCDVEFFDPLANRWFDFWQLPVANCTTVRNCP